jgi:DNA-binding transcriptional ArsR family regulator
MEYDQRVIIRLLCKERVPPEDIHARLEAQFGDATSKEYSEWRVRRWCHYVRQAREDLHDEVRSGRPLIDFFDTKILALLDEQFCYSAYSIAEALGVSHSTILSHLQESFGMKIIVSAGSHTS